MSALTIDDFPKWKLRTNDLIKRCVEMKREAMELGLIRTHHAFDEVTTAIGWEVAEMQQKALG